MKFFTTLGAMAFALFFTTTIVAQTEQDIPFSDLPPTQEFGKCYAKCKAADVYETTSQQVLVKEASSSLKKVAAVYGKGSESVLIKEGRTDYKVIPATYTTVTERVLIQPELKRVRTIPAKYRTETRSVLVSEARGQWVKKKKDPNCFSDNPEDCYIACYEEVPAKYRNEKYQVLDQAARTTEETIPAKYQTVTKRVIKEPARVIEVPVDAVYKNISTKTLVSPEAVSEVVIPAVYKTVNERRLVKKGGYSVWTEILCAAKTSNSTVRSVQKALQEKGYNVGAIDGVMGVQTQTALKQFQTDNGLPIGNFNLETLKALGVSYN